MSKRKRDDEEEEKEDGNISKIQAVQPSTKTFLNPECCNVEGKNEDQMCECQICRINKKLEELLPCHHYMCYECIQQLPTKTCPFCRVQITSYGCNGAMTDMIANFGNDGDGDDDDDDDDGPPLFLTYQVASNDILNNVKEYMRLNPDDFHHCNANQFLFAPGENIITKTRQFFNNNISRIFSPIYRGYEGDTIDIDLQHIQDEVVERNIRWLVAELHTRVYNDVMNNVPNARVYFNTLTSNAIDNLHEIITEEDEDVFGDEEDPDGVNTNKALGCIYLLIKAWGDTIFALQPQAIGGNRSRRRRNRSRNRHRSRNRARNRSKSRNRTKSRSRTKSRNRTRSRNRNRARA
jgi:hypothetical protein